MEIGGHLFQKKNGQMIKTLKKILIKYGQKAMVIEGRIIVFIGLKNQMNEKALKNKLDGFLIKNYSINLENTLKLKDPFQEWFKSEV